MKPWLALCALASLAAPAAAQFDLFDWDYTPGGPGSTGFVSPTGMGFAAGFNDPTGFQGFLTTAPVAGTVTVTIVNYTTWDGMCGACVPVFAKDGSLTTLARCSTYDESFEFDVGAGDQFGLGLQTNLPTWPAFLGFEEFRFEPAGSFAYWTDLGQGLGGLLGPPVLAGQGLVHGGMPIKLIVSNAAPHVPATLVIGLSALNAPFKGGVLVPSPNLVFPGLLIGMGTLELSATWPLHMPAGAQLWMQVWIVDETAPLGLSATNGLLAASP